MFFFASSACSITISSLVLSTLGSSFIPSFRLALNLLLAFSKSYFALLTSSCLAFASSSTFFASAIATSSAFISSAVVHFSLGSTSLPSTLVLMFFFASSAALIAFSSSVLLTLVMFKVIERSTRFGSFILSSVSPGSVASTFMPFSSTFTFPRAEYINLNVHSLYFFALAQLLGPAFNASNGIVYDSPTLISIVS